MEESCCSLVHLGGVCKEKKGKALTIHTSAEVGDLPSLYTLLFNSLPLFFPSFIILLSPCLPFVSLLLPSPSTSLLSPPLPPSLHLPPFSTSSFPLHLPPFSTSSPLPPPPSPLNNKSPPHLTCDSPTNKEREDAAKRKTPANSSLARIVIST